MAKMEKVLPKFTSISATKSGDLFALDTEGVVWKYCCAGEGGVMGWFPLTYRL